MIFTSKQMDSPFMWGTALHTHGFVFPENPLKKIIFNRALTTSFSEKLALDVFDGSALIHQLTCNCDHQVLGLYVVGAMYLFWSGRVLDDKKLQNIEYYTKYKRTIKQIMLVFFLIFTKNVDNAI